jgi:hypothetical protein
MRRPSRYANGIDQQVSDAERDKHGYGHGCVEIRAASASAECAGPPGETAFVRLHDRFGTDPRLP